MNMCWHTLLQSTQDFESQNTLQNFPLWSKTIIKSRKLRESVRRVRGHWWLFRTNEPVPMIHTSYFGRSRHTYSSQQQALHVSHWPSAFMNVEAFLCFGLSFSLQNHINLLFIQHFPCCYAIISKILRNFAVVNISVI